MSAVKPSAAYEVVGLAVERGVALVTLERPEAMNAFNMQLKEELGLAMAECGEREDVRAVILTGSGRAFSAGGDIVQMDPDRSPATTRQRMLKLLSGTVAPVARLEKPVIAAINGHCHGLGVSIAMACDIVYSAQSAVFSMAFTKVGLIPDGAAIFYLPRLVGLQRAKELIFTARRFDPQEALELGLVGRVVPDEELLPAARELAEQLASGPTLAYGLSKRLLDQAPLLSFEDAADLEAYGQAVAMSSRDHAEGVAAFKEKRSPHFEGR
jgi:2-(1,2-epoxy-1,2-dihydrophenyl)acetyl-CoA isomerase